MAGTDTRVADPPSSLAAAAATRTFAWNCVRLAARFCCGVRDCAGVDSARRPAGRCSRGGGRTRSRDIV